MSERTSRRSTSAPLMSKNRQMVQVLVLAPSSWHQHALSVEPPSTSGSVACEPGDEGKIVGARDDFPFSGESVFQSASRTRALSVLVLHVKAGLHSCAFKRRKFTSIPSILDLTRLLPKSELGISEAIGMPSRRVSCSDRCLWWKHPKRQKVPLPYANKRRFLIKGSRSFTTPLYAGSPAFQRL